MCSHYQGIKRPEAYREVFQAEPPATEGKEDMWPCYLGSFIRRHPHAAVGDEAVPPHEALIGQFGLVPHWADALKLGRHTYNARSETVATKPSFRDAWRHARHCIIPAMAIYEPDWRSGKAIPTRISRADDQPMGIAGLWDQWKSPGGETVYSFTMLTINADQHPLMNLLFKPTDEKRMVVILEPEQFDDWLQAPATRSMEFLQPFPAEGLRVG